MDPDFPVRIRIFRIGSGFLADPDSQKYSDPDPDKRIRIRNTGLLSQWRAQTLRGRGEGLKVAIALPPLSPLDPFQSYEKICTQ